MKRYVLSLAGGMIVLATAITVIDTAAQENRGGGRDRFRQTDSTGLIPLCDMGKDEQYKGQDGGLYGEGQNDPPPAHAAGARRESAVIRPLDAEGKPAADGKIVLMAIGMSNTRMEFAPFKELAAADPDKSPKVVVINAAIGGMDVEAWAKSRRTQWGTAWEGAQRRLKEAGVTPQQVQVVWLKQAKIGPARSGEFPLHARELADGMRTILQIAKEQYPNLRIAYLSSRIYAGHAAIDLNPEPYAYESAFPVRWLIQEQIRGDAELNYDPAKGPVKCPLLLWGPYLWADGVTPRSDGLAWLREDLAADGTHPSGKSGAPKVANLLLDFFKTNPLARTWYLAADSRNASGSQSEAQVAGRTEEPAGQLPDGKEVVTLTGSDLIKPPAALCDVPVARTPPAVDFLYYPGQTYKGNPWSNWGDGIAIDGRYYSAIGDHKAPDGNACVYEYDAIAKTLTKIVDLRQVLAVPAGKYTPGKIHSRLDIGSDGRLYFSTHRGSTKVTTDEFGYKGDWIIRHDPKTGQTEVVARGPAGKQCIPCSVLDPDHLIFYGGTAAGDPADKRCMFFAWDVNQSKLLYSGYDGPARYMVFARSTGSVYFVPDLTGRLFRYHPDQKAPVALDVELGLRAATQETPDGFVYTVSKDDATIYRFNTKTEKAEPLGAAAVGTQTYITSIDADPAGRYLYYVPGAHGGSEKDGAAVVQFDAKTRSKKVIAFLHPFLKQEVGYTPLGTFSTALSPAGDILYVTWNGNLGGSSRGRLTWDACALTVIHIPPSECLP